MSVAKKLVKKSVDEKLLKKLVPLNTLGADRLRELAEKSDIESASPGRTLFKRGDSDAKTYYLLSGDLEVQLANGQNVSIKADTPAALHPLLDARPRPATAVIKSHATLLVIDTGLFEILVNYDQKQKYEVSEIQAQDESDWLTRFLQSLSAMNIPVKNIEHLMQRMQELPVRAGETVIRQTDVESQHYYVVKEGRCVVTKHATSADKTPIRIAELTAGIGFGEEALLAEQPRSASVTMLTDGRLMRLAKADFTQLIADPALHYVSYSQAQQMVLSGALWLDTRSSAEHRDRSIDGSIHIPLMGLRSKIKELNAYGKYIAFCDSGNRATAAAFLLRQMGFSAYVLSDGLRDVPAATLRSNAPLTAITSARVEHTDAPIEQLKPRPHPADTVGDTARRDAALTSAQAEVESLRAQLAAARAAEQGALQQSAHAVATSTREQEAAQAEQARMRERIAELESRHTTADRTLASHQAQVDEFNLNLTAADAAYNSAQKELSGLNHTHAQVTEQLKCENAQLQTRVAATTAEFEHLKNELERAVERNRTAEEAIHSAEREIARLQAEADAAQRNAAESLRRASESESLQASILKEVQRKIEAAELMRLEAEEQAQRAREAAELSRKRAEQESRKVAEAEAARAKAQEESERRARLTEDIRKKAEEEMARLKKEAEAARTNADEAKKKSQLADAARRRLELEMQQARAQSEALEKPATPTVENDLDELERELAQLQQKLEAKKHAAVTRNQQARQAEEKQRATEPEVVQNVYDLHQKTQKLPVFKPNQAAPNDVGKVRKSGWISDSILWETTIGLREDSEAEKFLDNENKQRAPAAAPTAKRQEPNPRAQASGELKTAETKRSVFTTRESAPTMQRHVGVASRGPQRIGLIALVAGALMAAGIGAYVMLHKINNAAPKSATSVTQTPPSQVTSDAATMTPSAATVPTHEATKSPALSNSNAAITRKETVSPNAATGAVPSKQKTETAKSPVRKPASVDPASSGTPATAEASPVKASAPAPLQAAPESAPTSQLQTSPNADGEPSQHAQPIAEPEPAEATPVVPTFTDAPRVN